MRVLVTALLSAGLSISAFAQDPATGRLVDVGGHKLFLTCTGRGAPTVLLDNGTGGWSIHWSAVQRQLARETRICSYDRAGYGRSDPGPGPRTAGRASAELWRLLDAAGERGPFVFVGPSFGGWVVRIAAASRPDRTAGVVFVDAAHEDQWEVLPGAIQMVEGGLKANGVLAERARARSVDPATIDVSGVDDLDAPALRQAMTDAKTYETLAAELAGVRESARQAGAVRSLGAIPLIVLTAGRSFDWFVPRSPETADALDDLNRRWRELQTRLLGLSSRSRQVVSEAGVHALVRTDPALVVRVIRELLVAKSH